MPCANPITRLQDRHFLPNAYAFIRMKPEIIQRLIIGEKLDSYFDQELQESKFYYPPQPPSKHRGCIVPS